MAIEVVATKNGPYLLTGDLSEGRLIVFVPFNLCVNNLDFQFVLVVDIGLKFLWIGFH